MNKPTHAHAFYMPHAYCTLALIRPFIHPFVRTHACGRRRDGARVASPTGEAAARDLKQGYGSHLEVHCHLHCCKKEVEMLGAWQLEQRRFFVSLQRWHWQVRMRKCRVYCYSLKRGWRKRLPWWGSTELLQQSRHRVTTQREFIFLQTKSQRAGPRLFFKSHSWDGNKSRWNGNTGQKFGFCLVEVNKWANQKGSWKMALEWDARCPASANCWIIGVFIDSDWDTGCFFLHFFFLILTPGLLNIRVW